MISLYQFEFHYLYYKVFHSLLHFFHVPTCPNYFLLTKSIHLQCYCTCHDFMLKKKENQFFKLLSSTTCLSQRGCTVCCAFKSAIHVNITQRGFRRKANLTSECSMVTHPVTMHVRRCLTVVMGRKLVPFNVIKSFLVKIYVICSLFYSK